MTDRAGQRGLFGDASAARPQPPRPSPARAPSSTHAPRQVAGYERGVVKGSGSSFRTRVQSAEPWQPPPDPEPRDDRERRGRAAFYVHREFLKTFRPECPTWGQLPSILREAWCVAIESARKEP